MSGVPSYIKLIFILLLLALCGLSACSPGHGKKNIEESDNSPKFGPLSRADPGYIQYLEKLSMLGQSVDMARIVSGSNLSWRSPASPPDPDGMLRLADAWISVHPYTLLVEGNKGAFSELSNPKLWSVMNSMGARGLYVAPTSIAGAVWAYDRKNTSNGEDIIQYNFSDTAGKESEYRRMLTGANKHQSVLGLDMAPAATGLGPDFFLAARWHRDYAGVYCMVEIDKQFWPLLPEVESQWMGKALNSKELAGLHEKGVLPMSLAQDSQVTGADRGWAVTGLINGIDGNSRRWAYRYYYSPDRPVLNWEDPSATAKRILSGSAVREVGMLGGALLGLNLEPFQGLEAGTPPSGYSGEPAIAAANSIGREVRRYGGWTWLRDELPLTHIADFASDGPDFIYDSALSPGVEHALLTGDATLLRYMIDELARLKIDFKHLVHSSASQDGISYSMPHLLDAAAREDTPGVLSGSEAAGLRARIMSELKEHAGDGSHKVPVKNDSLMTTSAGLALLALGVRDQEQITPELKIEAANGLLLINFFKAMQPGIYMISGQDLVGALPLGWKAMVDNLEDWDTALTTRGAYGLLRTSGSLMVTRQGVARTDTLFGAVDEQIYTPKSFVSELGSILKARSRIGLPRATFLGRLRTSGAGSVALLHRLPDEGGHMVVIANFSRGKVNESLDISSFKEEMGSLGKVENIMDNNNRPTLDGRHLNVSLGPWKGMAILINNNSRK